MSTSTARQPYTVERLMFRGATPCWDNFHPDRFRDLCLQQSNRYFTRLGASHANYVVGKALAPEEQMIRYSLDEPDCLGSLAN